MTERVCIYLRVSTSQQAQHDLSIPDQRDAVLAYAAERDWEVVAEYMEPGASGRDDQRPQFQEMIGEALLTPPRFTKILVHSMSRFLRDGMFFEMYRRQLDANDVSIVSVSQNFGDGEMGVMAVRFMAMIDEMNSAETAKHVKRTMLANAKQNFWNGSRAPMGYKIVVADVRGNKEKKRLEIEPESADLVRLIFDLYLNGDGQNGPLGITSIVKHLNDRGLRTPLNRPFYSSYVAKILKSEIYTGQGWYNRRNSRTGKARPKEEWVPFSSPQILDPEKFQRAQVQLAERSPAVTAPRLVNSSVMLTGLAKCGSCGAKMRRTTGKGGRYAYYSCSAKISALGKPECRECTINADVLDDIVIGKLCDELLVPDRVKMIVSEVANNRSAQSDTKLRSLEQLRAKQQQNQKRLANLMNALADGTVEASATFRETVKGIESDLERADRLISDHERIISERIDEIDGHQAEAVATQLKDKLEDSSPALKKRVIRTFVKEVFIGPEEIAIVGPKADFAEVVTGSLKA